MRIDDPIISGSIEFITGARADYASASVFNLDLTENSDTIIIPAESVTGSLNENIISIPAAAVSGTLGSNVEIGGGVSIANATSASYSATASYIDNIYTENLSGYSEYTINHNLGFNYPLVQFYDTATSEQVLPDVIRTMSDNQISASFSGLEFNGVVVIKK